MASLRTHFTTVIRLLAGLLLLACGPLAHAAYSCTVTATSSGLIYQAPSPRDVTGSATLTCTRSAGDPNSLSYRLKASDGLNANTGTQPYRRVRLGTTANRLYYALRRSSTCNDSTDWRAPTTGASNVATGTLDFGVALTATTTLSYCIRVRVGAGNNPAAPAAGVYSDTFGIFAQYPNSNAGVLSPSAPVVMTVGVNNQCVFNTYPGNLSFNYTAFSTTAQTASTSFLLRCSSGLPWSVSVSPNPAVVQGLRYTVTPSPASGSGNGNTGQAVTLTGSMPAGQAGTCNGPSCAASQAHTVTITY
jgi:hypothetical protein